MRRILGLALIAVVFAAACGSSGGTNSPSGSAAAGTQGSGTQATQTAADNGGSRPEQRDGLRLGHVI